MIPHDRGDRLTRVLLAIDRLNGEDPHRVTMGGGAPRPWEIVHAERMTDWVLRLRPEASEALRIAARGQHVRRWTIPRERYPQGRAGYLKWRETLKAFHADTVAGLMHEAGYAEEDLARVRRLMSKRELGGDAQTQTLEDALCLVFLETQFADLRGKTPEDKMRDIVRKTWAKMSPPARAAALTLPLPADDRRALADWLKGV